MQLQHAAARLQLRQEALTEESVGSRRPKQTEVFRRDPRVRCVRARAGDGERGVLLVVGCGLPVRPVLSGARSTAVRVPTPGK